MFATVTQAQYDVAKDIILDLLGWGVPPEYLVSCGASREIVYYVFIELNLRLPNNLDTTGLPPLLPLSLTYSSPEPITPPATSNSSRPRGMSVVKRPTGDLHPSLPQKPPAPHGTPSADGTPLSVTATPFVPSASLSAIPMQSADSPPSLIDMEQQRRQELLARKAVLASRKKQVANTSSSATSSAVSHRESSELNTPLVASATVDDFLKTIGSVNGDGASGEKSVAGSSEDQMDVDDQIPGLSLTTASELADLSATRSPSSGSVSPNSVTFPSAESEGSVRSSSADQNSVPSPESSDSSGNSTPQPPSIGPRRVTKRPVASDFVDMDTASNRPHGQHHYHAHNHHPYPRKKFTSFAGLTAYARRIVIDLSDSEEDSEDAATRSQLPPSQQPSRPPTRLGLSASLPVVGMTSSPGGLAKPAALHEKEQEIRKMRELIAQRERARLDKLTAVSVPCYLSVFYN